MVKTDYDKLKDWIVVNLETTQDLGRWIADYLQWRSTLPNATPEGTERLIENSIIPAVENFIQEKVGLVYSAIADNPEYARRWHLPSAEKAAEIMTKVLYEYFDIAITEMRYPSLAEAAERVGESVKEVYNIMSFVRHFGWEI
jgi:hypothetical protein